MTIMPHSQGMQPAAEPVDKDIVDETSEDSFPASDPPSWTVVTGSGSPQSNAPARANATAKAANPQT